MVIRPSGDVARVIQALGADPSARPAEGAAAPRFDAALLQAAKLSRDSAPEGPAFSLSQRVRQALEVALSSLDQLPLEQLKTLAAQPGGLGATLDSAALAGGLAPAEKAQLGDMLAFAVPRLIQFRSPAPDQAAPASPLASNGAPAAKAAVAKQNLGIDSIAPQAQASAKASTSAAPFAAVAAKGAAAELAVPLAASGAPASATSAPAAGLPQAEAGLSQPLSQAPVASPELGLQPQAQAPVQPSASGQAAIQSASSPASSPELAAPAAAAPELIGAETAIPAVKAPALQLKPSLELEPKAALKALGAQASPAKPAAAPESRSRSQAGDQTANAVDLAALAASLLAPMIISTRTDDGSGARSALAPAAAAPSNPAVAESSSASLPQASETSPRGRVIQLAVSGGSSNQGANNAGAAAAAPAIAAAQPAQVPALQAPVVSGDFQPQAGASKAPAAVSGAESRLESNKASASPASPTKAEASAGEAVKAQRSQQIKAPEGMEVKASFGGSMPPAEVEQGSQVTLKGDGTWVLPEAESAKQSSELKPAPGQTQPAPAASAPEARSAPAPAASSFEAPSGISVPSAAPRAEAGGQLSGPTQPQVLPAAVSAQAAAASRSAPAAELAAAALPLRSAQASDAGLPETGAPEPEAASGQRAASAESLPGREASPQAEVRGALAGALAAGAPLPSSPIRNLAQRAANDYSLQQNVFRQVSEALQKAPEGERGRLVIQLKPAELGEVQVDLILAGGKLTARLVASRPEVRDAFVRDLPNFKAGLESQGVTVHEVSVAVRAGIQDQPQGQPQQQATAWWQGGLEKNSAEAPAGATGVAYEAGQAYAENSKRFSAFA